MTPRFGTELALLDPCVRVEAPTECPPVRVVLAHWARLGRAALRALLDGQADIVVVGEAGSGEEAVHCARQMRPDVVLMARSVPGLDGLSTLRDIRADVDLAEVKVLFLTGSASDDDVFSAVRGGASGVLLNDAEPAELVGAVRVVGRGDALLSPAIARRLIDEISRSRPEQQPPCPDEFAELTTREREVLALAAQGLTNHEIAQRLLVSAATAKTHVSRVMIKLGVHDRAKLVAVAYQSGFVEPSRLLQAD